MNEGKKKGTKECTNKQMNEEFKNFHELKILLADVQLSLNNRKS